jgi:hypothetical protein
LENWLVDNMMEKKDRKKTTRLYNLADGEMALKDLKRAKSRIQQMIQQVKTMKTSLRNHH